MLSILMPAKNASEYIEAAVSGLISLSEPHNFELIIIEDHSTDNTLNILLGLQSSVTFLQVYVNSGQGKIDALNYGYSLAKGNFIKTIDADDVFLPTAESMRLFVNHQYDVVVHGAVIVDEFLNKIGSYEVNKKYILGEQSEIINNLTSLPRCSFSFSRKVAEDIFPIPREMEYEDVWMSAVIKLYKYEIFNYKELGIYLYRQHANQAFGGILTYDKSIIRTRANTMLSMIEFIETSSSNGLLNFDFTSIKKYNTYLKRNYVFDVVSDGDLSISMKLKCLLFSHFGFFVPMALKIKWYMDSKK